MNRKILLVEDNPAIQEAIKFVLDSEGYETVLANHGEEALNLLNDSLNPDLIILDIMMPVMNGIQFRETQLRDARLAAIPTVALSADRTFLNKGMGQFNGVLKKPVDLEDLLNILEKSISVSAK